ncbi:discoidin domain-containing receptor 2-like [Sinocyclocheilus grahami]|uniref:discoidin domain-containing receptor 2-like n=1 Tax=Sinocyclocheilus grahami TaxID=75366 RepID=UPI0007AC956E|nr:PREDICTED: discoidin domain-containing receptor 2-like [Sinocyclocheilus grahami]
MLLYLLLTISLANVHGQIDPAHCRYPLGMEDGRIKNEDITASSQWYETTGPQYARLNCEEGDGAWCPAGQLQPADVQYLQLDLRQLIFLTVVATQGRYARNSGNEFARKYRLEYSRDGHRWISWRNRFGSETIMGNINTYDSVVRDLHPPIITRFLRLIPVTDAVHTVCMRVELFGCTWKLSGGLGQLTDGVIGQDDFVQKRLDRLWPGYDYVGWRNDSLGPGYVEMEFQFDRQRNFTSMKVHSNNMFSRGVKIFASVSCVFKLHLISEWEAERVEFHTVLDDRNPSARYVTVPLKHRLATALCCRFYFADTWMMFSEISFQSATNVLPTQRPPVLTPPSYEVNSKVPQTTQKTEDQTTAKPLKPGPSEEGSTSILIGCLVTIILLLVVIIFLILWCQYVCKVLEKAPRRILKEEVTVRLSSSSDTIILQTPPVPPRLSLDPPYERIFLLDPQYQDPAALRNKLPELSQSAEASGIIYYIGAHASVFPLSISLSMLTYCCCCFQVHLCEAEGLAEFLGEDAPLPEQDGRPVLVAVKQLRADATSNARNDFLKEIKIMSRLNNPNIIQLLCVCVSSDPLCMVTEYMENGDLNMFLSQREIESTLTHANNIPSVSIADLLHMSVQISSGMKYLASLNFVHRDLATRNCLLDRHLTIKISDFGMSRNLYSSDYYRIQGRAVLPIRWMAWESILLGKFTTASDVWAFGVTLWEIFTLCKEQPYSLLSDEQVIENTGEFFRNQGRQIFLSAPPLCPSSLFELMMRCWSRDIADRTTFHRLYQALRTFAPHS